MRNHKKETRGIALVTVLMIGVILFISTGAYLNSSINQARNATRLLDRLSSLYIAEKGIAYAGCEETAANYNFLTHYNQTNRIQPPDAVPVPTLSGVSIDQSGLYNLSGKGTVKIYPEQIGGISTGVLIIHSQSTVDGVTQIIEQRLGQVFSL